MGREIIALDYCYCQHPHLNIISHCYVVAKCNICHNVLPAMILLWPQSCIAPANCWNPSVAHMVGRVAAEALSSLKWTFPGRGQFCNHIIARLRFKCIVSCWFYNRRMHLKTHVYSEIVISHILRMRGIYCSSSLMRFMPLGFCAINAIHPSCLWYNYYLSLVHNNNYYNKNPWHVFDSTLKCKDRQQ